MRTVTAYRGGKRDDLHPLPLTPRLGRGLPAVFDAQLLDAGGLNEGARSSPPCTASPPQLIEQFETARNIATLTRGAYCRFDPGAARQLAELLRAVAVFTVGGLIARQPR